MASLHVKHVTFVLRLTEKNLTLVINPSNMAGKYQLLYSLFMLLPMWKEHARSAGHGENKSVGSLYIAINGCITIVICIATCIVIVYKGDCIT